MMRLPVSLLLGASVASGAPPLPVPQVATAPVSVSQELARRLRGLCPVQVVHAPAIERVLAAVSMAMTEDALRNEPSRAGQTASRIHVAVKRNSLRLDGFPTEPLQARERDFGPCIQVRAPTPVDWRALGAQQVELASCGGKQGAELPLPDFDFTVQVHVDCAKDRLAVVVSALPIATPKTEDAPLVLQGTQMNVWLDLRPSESGLTVAGGCIPEWSLDMARVAGLRVDDAKVYRFCMPLYLHDPSDGHLTFWKHIKRPAATKQEAVPSRKAAPKR